MKGLSKEEREVRSDLVAALKDRIEAVADGNISAAKQGGDSAPSASHGGIKFDSTYGKKMNFFGVDYWFFYCLFLFRGWDDCS